MTELESAILAVKENEYSFCKFISANDAGSTGAHQAGIYIPKNSIDLIFDGPGQLGVNMERFATMEWTNGSISNCRFIYYGQGTRNEYRMTRIGRSFNVDDLIVIVKKSEGNYLGFLLQSEVEKTFFLKEFGLDKKDTNKLINYSLEQQPELLSDVELPAIQTPSIQESGDFITHQINFRPKAHILILLGEELIKSPVMAIYELIKNGYDADASNVTVTFEHISNLDDARIFIKDTGTGITSDILKNVWFEPGTDFRKPINNAGVRQIKRSPIFNRIPMGEKGVGRFAVHKLGNKIKLISRPAEVIYDSKGFFSHLKLLEYELTVNIDWRKFSQGKYLEDVNIEWSTNFDPRTFFFKDSHGTFIQIESLKHEWTRGMARQLKRQTLSMVSPKNDSSKFKIDLDFQNWWLNDIPDTTALLEKAPYKLAVFVDTDYNMTFSYEFRLANNSDIGKRLINPQSTDEIDKRKSEFNIKGKLTPFFRDSLEDREFEKPVIENVIKEFESAELPYGNIMLELYSFDLDSASLRDVTNFPKQIKDLLKDHAGIKVFKGDLRVYDYGDPGNDWLNLDNKRVNNKAWFSNNQVIGFIYLDPENSSALVEKTNREGFIHNSAYENLLVVLDFILTQFMVERQVDRVKWLQYNKKGTGQNSFSDRLSGFKQLISSAIIDEESQEKLLLEAEKIEEKYEQDRDALLIPAGVGMTASFAMHEIEKLVPRMEESVKEDPINKFVLTSQIEELRDYSDGLLSVLKKGTNANLEIRVVIEQAISNYRSRMNVRAIKTIVNQQQDANFVKCDKRLLITILMNIVDNSIYWLGTIYREDKSIYFDIAKIEHGVSLLIVDNGPGFQESIENIIMPYYSRKKNGIGIGMYLVDTVMIQYGRLNIIYDRDYLSSRGIPIDYTGAAVELIFNKNQG